MGIKKYAFKSDIKYPLLFQSSLPHGRICRPLFVTENFVKILRENEVKGFKYKQIWDSEETLERRLFWEIKPLNENGFHISTRIVVNGLEPFPMKECILNSKQIQWLCSELRKLKKDDFKNELNKLKHIDQECRLLVSISIFDDNSCIVLNPIWKDKKKDLLENVQLPISIKSKNPLKDNVEPFLKDLEGHIKLKSV